MADKPTSAGVSDIGPPLPPRSSQADSDLPHPDVKLAQVRIWASAGPLCQREF